LLLIGQNLGVALMPELAATVLGNSDIAYVLISDLTMTRMLYVLTHPRRSPAPATPN
jgi:DNA-binding transcriptional LysR family regulator